MKFDWRENELSELVNLKNQLETDLLNSPLKQKAGTIIEIEYVNNISIPANLREELVRLGKEERELIEEEQNKESLDEKVSRMKEGEGDNK